VPHIGRLENLHLAFLCSDYAPLLGNTIFQEFVIFGDDLPARVPAPSGGKLDCSKKLISSFQYVSPTHRVRLTTFILFLLIARLLVVRLTRNQVQMRIKRELNFR
jgi:hypothetical protein